MPQYEYSMRIGIGNVNADGRLRLDAAVDMLQNGSWFQLDTETEVQDFFRRENAGMYLSNRQMEIVRMPSYGERVTIASWIYTSNRLMGERNTMMYGEKGDVLIASIETGVFIHLDTARPLRVPQQLIDSIEFSEPHSMHLRPRKIEIPVEGGAQGESFTVRARHLDIYHHMNNARYVQAVIDALPDGEPPRFLHIAYQQPARIGAVIYPVIYREEGRIVVVLRGEEAVHATAELFDSGQ